MVLPPVALVTGSARRIGKAIVEDLAAHGWGVAIHYNHSGNDADALAESIRKAGGKAITVGAELADRSALSGLIQKTSHDLGKPSLLVNNASLFEGDDPGAINHAAWDRALAVNLGAPVFLSAAFATALPEDAEGNIVNIVDQRVLRLTPQFFSYQLTKSALWTATQMQAQAFAPRIRVNAIGPGPALPAARMSEGNFKDQTASVILGHGPELGEFGRTVRFLVENRSITGQMIALDGGQHLAWKTADVVNVEE